LVRKLWVNFLNSGAVFTERTLLNKVTLAIVVVVFWLLLSGHYEPLFLFFMLLSTVVVMFLAGRMNSHHYEINPFQRSAHILRFFSWFVVEVIKSNVQVALSVWGLQPVKPAMREIRLSQKTVAGKAIFANAITLTPGTLSMHIDEEKQTILVHALNPAMLDDLEKGEMDRAVSRLESE